MEDGLQEEVARVVGGGAENDLFGVEGVHEDADALREAEADFIPHFDGDRNAQLGAFADGLEAEVLKLAVNAGELEHGVVGAETQSVLQTEGDGTAAAVGFEAAEMAAAAHRAVDIQNDVAEFAGDARRAREEFAAGDDAAADACAHGQIDDVLLAFGAAEEPLGENARVRVIVHVNRHVQTFYEVVTDWNGVPCEIRRLHDAAAFHIERAGGADAAADDVGQLEAGLGGDLLGDVDDLGHDLIVGCRGTGRNAIRGDDFAVGVRNADGDLGSADIDAQNFLRFVGHDDSLFSINNLQLTMNNEKIAIQHSAFSIAIRPS